MGRNQHGKDKMYVTQTEYGQQFGQKGSKGHAYKKLPFYCCSLTLTPFEHPVLSPEGFIFDLSAIVPFIRKNHVNPVTGTPLSGKDLIKLNFHKNTDGQFACPVTGKVFTENSRIVALKPTGNVFSWDAVQTLCIQGKSMRDLLTDEAFVKDGACRAAVRYSAESGVDRALAVAVVIAPAPCNHTLCVCHRCCT